MNLQRLLFSERIRSLAVQAGMLVAVIAVALWVWGNLQKNLKNLGISLSFRTFSDTSGFPISETLPVPLPGPLEFFLATALLVGLFVSLRRRLSAKQSGALRHSTMKDAALIHLFWLALPLLGWMCVGFFTGKWSTLTWSGYTPESAYSTALAVGLMNTVKVAALGIALSTALGLVIGLMRTSAVPGLRALGRAYVELLRNVPLLLQLVFWYALVLNAFPLVQNGLNIRGAVFLNNRGLFLPEPVFSQGGPQGAWAIMVFCVGLSLLILLTGRVLVGQLRAHGHLAWSGSGTSHNPENGGPSAALPGGRRVRWLSLASVMVALGIIVVAERLLGLSVTFHFPELVFGGRNLRGGWTLTPEFLALVLGLSFYTAAFIAEIVRSGISAVDKGQIEAARALGLSSGKTLKLIVLPQALRVMVPPITSQYLNLAKNSSLAVAVGYPELVSVGGTILNQTGKSVEVILIWMFVYLTLSLLIALVMNVYNAQVKIVGRPG